MTPETNAVPRRTRDAILEPEDPGVAPELLTGHSDQAQQVGRLSDHVLDKLEELDTVLPVDGERGGDR